MAYTERILYAFESVYFSVLVNTDTDLNFGE